MVRILVVEDDRPLLEAICAVFRGESYQTDEAMSGDEGYFYAEQGIHDLLVLDVMLPGRSGISVIQELRTKGMTTPILLLTAKDSVEDRVAGLDAGADDYLVKPFAVPELLARARALLRRQGNIGAEGEIQCGRLQMKPRQQEAYIEEVPLILTSKEYELLEYLLLNKRQIVTREQIFDRIWGFDSETSFGIVDLYVHYLRKKLLAHDYDRLIQTVRGIGYMVKEIG